jgi:hypothetical protein
MIRVVAEARRHTLSIFVHLVLFRLEPAFFQCLRGFRAGSFYENWKYLPGGIGKNFRSRQLLPSKASGAEISAGTEFPRPGKIDV